MCRFKSNPNVVISNIALRIAKQGVLRDPVAKILAKFNTADIKTEDNSEIAGIAANALDTVGIKASISKVMNGPVISRIYATLDEVTPAQIKLVESDTTEKTIQMIFGSDKVSLAADPNTKSIILDVPNTNRSIVPFGNIFNTLSNDKMTIPVALGVDVTGNPVSIDLADAPHMLIAGQTGAGKSVCINSIIMSIIARLSSSYFKLTLIDPKAVELSVYSKIPHLNSPIITDPDLAIKALEDMCKIMDDRKKILAQANVRSIASYNEKVRKGEDLKVPAHLYAPMPYHIVVIDEFADLMLTAEKELVSYVSRIAAVGRALGIHLILATQRPSVKVIPGEIKANIPTRIAFKVAQAVDSMTIIDQLGAEKLLGKGDMILKFKGLDAQRVHGCFISDEEIEPVTEPSFVPDDVAMEFIENNKYIFDHNHMLFGCDPFTFSSMDSREFENLLTLTMPMHIFRLIRFNNNNIMATADMSVQNIAKIIHTDMITIAATVKICMMTLLHRCDPNTIKYEDVL